jgi:zeaxanthin glucosyltransferase
MATIAIISDMDEGHLFPSFGIARSLQDKGHEIFYLTIQDNIPYLANQGFPFELIFCNIYPEGYHRLLKEVDRKAPMETRHLPALIGGALDDILQRRKPDLLLVSYFLPIETLLLYYKYAVPMMIYTTFLREPSKSPFNNCIETIISLSSAEPRLLEQLVSWIQEKDIIFSSLAQLAEPLKHLREIITCPAELDFPDREFEGNVYHVEPSIRIEKEKKKQLVMPSDKIILYGSFGSQTADCKSITREFVDKLIEMMQMPAAVDWHLFLATGDIVDSDYAGRAPNITLLRWAPQMEILEQASLALIHGGLGTIKECIHFEVPMIVFPVVNDQFANADRVEFHRIGEKRSLRSVVPGEICELVSTVLRDDNIRRGLRKMNACFREFEQKQAGMENAYEVIRKSLIN